MSTSIPVPRSAFELGFFKVAYENRVPLPIARALYDSFEPFAQHARRQAFVAGVQKIAADRGLTYDEFIKLAAGLSLWNRLTNAVHSGINRVRGVFQNPLQVAFGKTTGITGQDVQRVLNPEHLQRLSPAQRRAALEQSIRTVNREGAQLRHMYQRAAPGQHAPESYGTAYSAFGERYAPAMSHVDAKTLLDNAVLSGDPNAVAAFQQLISERIAQQAAARRGLRQMRQQHRAVANSAPPAQGSGATAQIEPNGAPVIRPLSPDEIAGSRIRTVGGDGTTHVIRDGKPAPQPAGTAAGDAAAAQQPAGTAAGDAAAAQQAAGAAAGDAAAAQQAAGAAAGDVAAAQQAAETLQPPLMQRFGQHVGNLFGGIGEGAANFVRGLSGGSSGVADWMSRHAGPIGFGLGAAGAGALGYGTYRLFADDKPSIDPMMLALLAGGAGMAGGAGLMYAIQKLRNGQQLTPEDMIMMRYMQGAGGLM